MAERSYRGLFWALAVGGVVLDQLTKYGIFRWLYNDGQGGEQEVIRGAFRLVTTFTNKTDPGGTLAALRTWSGEKLPYVNEGALFGQRPTQWLDWLFGSSLATGHAWVDNLVFSVISVVAAIGIVYWTTRQATARDRTLCASLGLILAGTVGNLYDRLIFDGVRDFLYFYLINWPVFNVADCCLVCGAVLLLAHAFLGKAEPAAKPAAAAAQVAQAN
jgi:lipoprotein signal peptidase